MAAARKRKQPARKTAPASEAGRDRFPTPGDDLDGDNDEQLMQALVHEAMHRQNLGARALLAELTAEKLRNGDALTPAERDWLAWTIDKLAAAGALPHLSKGRALVDYEKQGADMRRVYDVLGPFAEGRKNIVDELESAAHALGMSYGAVRRIYYSPSYRMVFRIPKK